MRPTDDKTRENIILAKKRGEKREKIAYWLNVSISTVDKVWRRFIETGSYSAIPYLGRKSSLDKETDAKIRATIIEFPDITLEELIEKLSLPLTISGLSKKLNRMGISYKKRLSTQANKNVQISKKSVVSGKRVKKN